MSILPISKGDHVPLFVRQNSDYRTFQCLRGSVFIIEGLIGVGKSTLCRSLANYLQEIGLTAQYYYEPKNEELLTQYIKNMSKYAYTFQLYMARERQLIYDRAHDFAQKGGIAIIDRGLPGDYAFAWMQYKAGNFTEEEWAIYCKLFVGVVSEPTLTIFLDCSPQRAYERMLKRCHPAERDTYTLQYFERLLDAYRQTMGGINHEIFAVDWNNDADLAPGARIDLHNSGDLLSPSIPRNLLLKIREHLII